VCCSVLQCVAVCCWCVAGVLQCVAVCCSVLQCVEESASEEKSITHSDTLNSKNPTDDTMSLAATHCNTLQHTAT